jgi:hypothetical protein
VVVWGRQWPPSPGPNIPPPPGPVKTLRASSYRLQVSVNGRRWKTVVSVNGVQSRVRDVLRFHKVSARYVRILVSSETNQTPPQLDELTVTG